MHNTTVPHNPSKDHVIKSCTLTRLSGLAIGENPVNLIIGFPFYGLGHPFGTIITLATPEAEFACARRLFVRCRGCIRHFVRP